MKSFSSALVSAAVLGQLTAAYTIGRHAHGHSHLHTKRVAEAAPSADVNSGYGLFNPLSDTDAAYLQKIGIKAGVNMHVASGAAVSVGEGDEYSVQLNNKGSVDIVVVAWSGSGQWGAVNAGFVGAAQADITISLKANSTSYLSYKPSCYGAGGAGGPISGALAPIYPGGKLTPFSGQVDDTWVEFTFTNDANPSATDVSRLINMGGHKVEVHNYLDKAAHTSSNVACSSTMDACSFVCSGSATNCIVGTLLNCPVGKANTLGSADAMDGGCGGLGEKDGVVEVNFY